MAKGANHVIRGLELSVTSFPAPSLHKTPRGQGLESVWRFEVNVRRSEVSGAPGEGVEAPHPVPCSMHLSHLLISELPVYPFIVTP